MKLTRRTKATLHFHLGEQEKQLLLEVLQLYPRVPPAHHQLTKDDKLPNHEENQRLLDDALAEHRLTNKNRLQEFLNNPTRFKAGKAGWRFSLSHPELEWLLQVLNDIRVGSWVNLGSPEEAMDIKVLNETTVTDMWAMELTGFFQARLLEGLSKRDP